MANMNLNEKREEYLSKLSEEERRITLSLWNEKRKEAMKANKEKKERVATLAEIAKQIGESDYVMFDDESDVNLTINEKCVAVAYGNMIRNPKTSFRDLNDLQKVVKDETDEGNKNGIVVNFITNGQDLGE